MLAASPMLLVSKMVKKKKKEVRQLGLHTFPSRRSFCFILEFVLDFRKDNLVIFVIRSLFPYQGLVLPYQGLMFLRHMRFGHWEICR